jgi:hypothetical protein
LDSGVSIKPRRFVSLITRLRLVYRFSYSSYRPDSSNSAVRFSGLVVKDETKKALEFILMWLVVR